MRRSGYVGGHSLDVGDKLITRYPLPASSGRRWLRGLRRRDLMDERITVFLGPEDNVGRVLLVN